MKFDHPCFFHVSYSIHDDGDFRPNNGPFCPWRSFGSGAARCDDCAAGRQSGRHRSSRLAPSSSSDRRRRSGRKSGNECTAKGRASDGIFPVLQTAGRCIRKKGWFLGFRCLRQLKLKARSGCFGLFLSYHLTIRKGSVYRSDPVRIRNSESDFPIKSNKRN